MTGIDHIGNETIELAAQWLAEFAPGEAPAPIVPELRTRFGITSEEACQAIRRAEQMRTCRRAFA